MPASLVVVCDDLGLQIGHARAALTPGEAFAVAERLIRAATKAIVLNAADAALVRDVVSDPGAYLRDAGSKAIGIAAFAKSSNK